MGKEMYFLAIETSCDDTAVAVMKATEKDNALQKIEAISNIVSSQTQLHAGYGGVYPFLAKREHQKNLPVVFARSVESFDISKLKFIAVTHGPGLDPCLWTGINFAQNLAKKYGLPLVGVNHLEAHFLANLLTLKIGEDEFAERYLPAACLVVSGGHTLLFLANAVGGYRLLGQTVDDAAGECFDKTARVLGLGYPGGPEIARLAVAGVRPPQKKCGGPTPATSAKVRPLQLCKTQNIDQSNPSLRSACSGSRQRNTWSVSLPRPMINQKNYNFSFSGLKTAALYDFQKRDKKIAQSDEYKIAMSHEIQQSIIDVLVKKSARAAKEFGAKSIIIGGGVSANLALRQAMRKAADDLKIEFIAPSGDLSMDNAAMAGVAGYFAFCRGKIVKSDDLKSQPNLGI